MSALEHLTEIYQKAQRVPFDDSSKIILMSDCHRGDGSIADTFAKNQNLYFAALTFYNDNKFTYIEIGDGDELWLNKKLENITAQHSDAFWLLTQFFKEGRLYFLFGNHDMEKRDAQYVQNNLYSRFSERENKRIPMFERVKVHEALVLKHKNTGQELFVVHGHQAGYFNDELWRFARFLARYLWRTLELVGVSDPTRPATNFQKKIAVDIKLSEWASKHKRIVVAGHTHRPVFPKEGEPAYFNDGSCVHPRCITGLEIEDGSITLIKWSVRPEGDGVLRVTREIIAGPRKLKEI